MRGERARRLATLGGPTAGPRLLDRELADRLLAMALGGMAARMALAVPNALS